MQSVAWIMVLDSRNTRYHCKMAEWHSGWNFDLPLAELMMSSLFSPLLYKGQKENDISSSLIKSMFIFFIILFIYSVPYSFWLEVFVCMCQKPFPSQRILFRWRFENFETEDRTHDTYGNLMIRQNEVIFREVIALEIKRTIFKGWKCLSFLYLTNGFKK